jgi:hypothetical protein
MSVVTVSPKFQVVIPREILVGRYPLGAVLDCERGVIGVGYEIPAHSVVAAVCKEKLPVSLPGRSATTRGCSRNALTYRAAASSMNWFNERPVRAACAFASRSR